MKRLISTTLAAALAFSAAGAATASAQPYQGPPGYNHDHDHGPGPGFYGPPGYHSAPPGIIICGRRRAAMNGCSRAASSS